MSNEAALKNEPYLERLFEILRGAAQPIMIEAGACDGYHSKIFAAAVPGLRLHCFEPDPRNVEICRAQGVPAIAEFRAAALGNVTGQVPFHMATPEPGGAIGSSSLSPFLPSLTAWFPWLREQRGETVQSYRLDDFLAFNNIGRVDLLWADVQGAERMLVEGMRGCWSTVRYFFTEHDSGYAHSSTLQELIDQLNAFAEPGANPWELVFEVGPNALLRNKAEEIGPLGWIP